MKLPKYAIENHQFTVVSIILLIIFGITSFISMPRSEDPQVQPPGASVFAVLPGASPVDIEELIVDPVETALNELSDLRFLRSTAEDGLAVTSVEFTAESDPDEKYAELVQKINAIRTELPENLLSLETLQWSTADVNIYQIAFISDALSFTQLNTEAERLKKQIERIDDVRKVKLWALPEREVRVSVDMEKLAMFHIPVSHVIGAVQDANTNIPGGFVDMDTRRLSISTSGSYKSLDEIRLTAIHSSGGKTVYIQDIANVNFAHEDITHIARVNGETAVFLTVQQKEKTNIFNISKQVEEIVDSFKQTMPKNVELHILFDQSESVSWRISGFFNNLLQGIILVGMVIFMAVNWRAAIIVMFAIPVSSLIGIGFLDVSGFGLEQISIAGLVIALGLLVDNAIVVTDNIARYMREGLGRKEAAVKGTSEVAWAITSATATTLCAFIPIIMMRNMTGDFIRSLPLTVVYTLAASLLISLTLTPYLSVKFLNISPDKKPHRLRQKLNWIVENKYRRILDYALNHKKLMLAGIFIVFSGSLVLFSFVGVSFFPKAEKPQFFINIEMPMGTSLDYTDHVAKDVEYALGKMPGIKYAVCNSGHGNPRIYYNMFPKRNNTAHSQLFVQLEKRDSKRLDHIITVLREQFSGYPGADIQIKELEQGPPVNAPIEIRVLGENMDVLTELAGHVENTIAADPRTVNVNNPSSTSRTDIKVRILREKANQYGVLLSEIDRTVRIAMAGAAISSFRDQNGKEYQIVIRLAGDDKAKFEDFDRITVSSRFGRLIPLTNLVSIELQTGPMAIYHFQRERSISITADVTGGHSATMVTRDLIKQLDQLSWPQGYHFYVAGEKENQEESFGGMMQAILIAIIAIFGVLVLQFRSYLQPLIVFMAIPLAVIGSVLFLFITGNSFGFTAFIGLTSLVGIVINNAIILVDYTNQLRNEGLDITAALKKAGETRFIPIILTTLTTIGGLLPLTLQGGSLWAPMGWTIIGGLLFSTFLTLVIVPVFYHLVTPAASDK